MGAAGQAIWNGDGCKSLVELPGIVSRPSRISHHEWKDCDQSIGYRRMVDLRESSIDR